MTDVVKLVGPPARNRWIPTELLRFAVDSAVNASRKGVTGGKKAYRIVQEKLAKERFSSHACIDEKKLKNHEELDETTYTEIETMPITQQTSVSTEYVVNSKPMKRTPMEEDIKGLDLHKPRKIFIRSRL